MTSGSGNTFVEEVGNSDPVTVVGGRTRWDVGGSVAAGVREIRAPAGIVRLDPAEMTVRVLAGTTVAELSAELERVGQRVLLPEPGPAATVGGVLAVGESDFRRHRHGPLRDSLLEARFVTADGSLVKAGGPTVKNVSGFDLCRILVGSLGTLGFLAEVVLRTHPIPPASCWLRGQVEPEEIVPRLWRPPAVLSDGLTTWVLLEGHAVDVAAERALLATFGFEETEGPPDFPPHRWSVIPSQWRDHLPPGEFIAEIGVGTLHAGRPQPVRRLAPRLVELHRQLKFRFDPTGRLNPGRAVFHGVEPA